MPILLPRLQHAWEGMSAITNAIEKAPKDLAKQLYFDDLVYDTVVLHSMLDIYGSTQVMAGTDYPFAIMDRDPSQRIEKLQLDGTTRRLLRRDNALRWLARCE